MCITFVITVLFYTLNTFEMKAFDAAVAAFFVCVYVFVHFILF